jgi:hypothetical protein
VQVNDARRSAITNGADHLATRHDPPDLRILGALHMGVHGVEIAFMTKNERPAAWRPDEDDPIGSGAHRGASAGTVGTYQVERIAIPTVVRTTGVPLNDAPWLARRRRQPEFRGDASVFCCREWGGGHACNKKKHKRQPAPQRAC